MTRTGFVAAAALSVVVTSPLMGQVPGHVIEPRTGIAFPVSLVPPRGGTAHHLVGTAVRTRTIFRIKVYALGFYVDHEAARTALALFAGMPREDLERSVLFYQALLEMKFDMTLRLVTARNVDGQDVADAFADALRPRLILAAQKAMPGAGAALEEFRRNFDVDEVAKGTEIVFSCSQGRRFEMSVEGRSRSTIASSALCWALFDVYLGETPISRDAKRYLVAGFAGLLEVRDPASDQAVSCRWRDIATSARGQDAGRRSVPEYPVSSCSGS